MPDKIIRTGASVPANRNNNSYPETKTFSGAAPEFTLAKHAQCAEGNITSTPPGFYSPYHTPSAWQIPTTRREVYAWCLHPDTLITMADFTQKRIEDIAIGDKVLTRDGTPGEVTVISKRETDNKLLRITTGASQIIITPEHYVFQSDDIGGDIRRIRSDEAEIDKYMISPKCIAQKLDDESIFYESNEDTVFHRIQSIEEVEYSGHVYDFRVDNPSESHSYLANHLAVSNCRYWYENEPIVGTAIDIYTNLGVNGYQLDCPSGSVLDFYEEMCNNLHFQQKLMDIFHELLLYGDCFPFLDLDCPECGGSGIDPDNGEKCEHSGAVWEHISIMDPNSVTVENAAFLVDHPRILFDPPEDLKRMVQTKQPPEAYAKLSEEIKKIIMSGQQILLNEIAITHLKIGSSPYYPYGTSLIRKLFPTLAYRDKLRQAQWLVAERHVLPVKIVKVGNDQRPASSEDLAAVEEKLASVANDPLTTLVTHHAFDYDWVGPSGKVLQITNEYEIINEDLQTGLQMNKAFLHGEGPNYSSAQVGLEVFVMRLEAIRRMIEEWVEDKIFKPIAIFNNFTQVTPRGNEKLLYPKFKFKPIDVADKSQNVQQLMQLRDNNSLSLQTLLEYLDIDYDTEIERIRQEDIGSLLTSADFGLGAAEGSGLGGGGGGLGGGFAGGAPMGGLPGEEGGMGAPGAEGGEMPGGEAGGAPPAPAGGMEASTMKENYKTAMSIRKEVMASLVDEDSLFENDVTGDAFRGSLPDEINHVENNPMFLGRGPDLTYIQATYYSNKIKKTAMVDSNEDERAKYFHPDGTLNPDMIETMIRTAAVTDGANPKVLFTSQESMLYDALVKNDLGLPMYAQYTPQSNPNFKLDAAYPTIKLGIEVDGEIWHNNPEAIEKDQRRDAALQQHGWIILRFTDKEIENRLDEVMQVIESTVAKRQG